MNISWEKPRNCKTEDRLYPDRCMLKWQGFLLSDHNEVMDYERTVLEQAMCEVANEARRESWDREVYQAWAQKRRLKITHRTLNGQDTLEGLIIELEADHLVFGTERKHIAYDNILDISDECIVCPSFW